MREVFDSLLVYRRSWCREGIDFEKQSELADRFERFALTNPDALWRRNPGAHFTGSALVTTPALDRVLLTLHRKLGLWLQLGGHADGEAKLEEVALRECEEESGLRDAVFLQHGMPFDVASPRPMIFDLDIHTIPARAEEPEHLHYDVRYILVTHQPERIAISEESHRLEWFTLEEAYRVTPEPSMHRQFDKLAFLKKRLQ